MQTSQYQVKKKSSGKYILIVLLIGGALFFFVVVVATIIGTVLPGMRGRVALLDVQGVIYDARGYVDELHSYYHSPMVRAIVVRIDTPGGSAAASQELYYKILELRRRKTKPIIASMGNVGASGGYYIACAADEVYANPATLTGSIGVIMNFANWQKLVKKVGVRFEVIKSGEHKDIGSPNRPMSEEEKVILQDVIDDVYDQFIEDIYRTRKASLEKACFLSQDMEEDSLTSGVVRQYLTNLADGRIFSGRQAFEYGLVDHLGTLDDAILRAGYLAGMRGRPKVYQKKKPLRFFGLLEQKLSLLIRQYTPDYPSLEYRFIAR